MIKKRVDNYLQVKKHCRGANLSSLLGNIDVNIEDSIIIDIDSDKVAPSTESQIFGQHGCRQEESVNIGINAMLAVIIA